MPFRKITMDLELDLDMDSLNCDGGENGSIIVYIDNPNQDQVNDDAPVARKRPKRPRAVAYQFFEWDENANHYQCKLCEYVWFVFSRLCNLTRIYYLQ